MNGEQKKGGAAAAGRAVGDAQLREGGGVMQAHKGGGASKTGQTEY